MSKIIAHIDMNCFYASVEEKYNPSLRGKPLAISGEVSQRHGIIVTANYPARDKGVKATMKVGDARRLCPNIKFMRPNFDRYQTESAKVFDLIRSYTPNVEVVSIDEAYIDLTEVKEPIKTMAIIQRRIFYELDLPSSVGVSYTKFFAKMASDMKKPKGFTIINKKNYKDILWSMDVSEMHGCGKSSASKLKKQNINTIGDLAEANDVILNSILGVQGLRLKQKALGISSDKLKYNYERKSIGNSKTYPRDLDDPKEISEQIRLLAKKVSQRASNRNYVGDNVSITIKFDDFKVINRAVKINEYINDEYEIYQTAMELLEENYYYDKNIRLLGVSLNNIKSRDDIVNQLDIFTNYSDDKNVKLHNVMKVLNKKYGKEVVKEIKSVKTKTGKKNIITTSFSKDFLED
ncbi:MAG: DNA polymerase IV [Gemella sp.]|nr:DNA polymerase IV [Gemella sp.]